jgi:hypothetical protein
MQPFPSSFATAAAGWRRGETMIVQIAIAVATFEAIVAALLFGTVARLKTASPRDRR